MNEESQDESHALKRAQAKRKFHKKSRKGCATCKKRRVKCDEGRPICANCNRMGIDCVYTTPASRPQGTQQPAKPALHAANTLETPIIIQEPSLSPNMISDPPPTQTLAYDTHQTLNMLDLRLMYHYTTKVWTTITDAGISDSKIWSEEIPMLAFKYPFLMHSVLAFSATHLSRTERGLDQCVTGHRADALGLLREAVLEMSPENTDALVAAALILIMDSLANASLPTSTSIKSLPPSAWIFHVKGAATILTAVWPLSEKSRFYKFISVDLGDLGEIGYDLISGELSTDTAKADMLKMKYSSIQCFDEEIRDMFPIPLQSPYLPTLAYMAKLHMERNKKDFILRVFAFPALLDKRFLGLLISCDLSAMRIMRCYYKLLRNFTDEMKDRVWFLEGVSSVLPVDVEEYSGGGGMHMMLDFLGGPSTAEDDGLLNSIPSVVQSRLLDTNNLPSSSITDSLGIDETSGLEDDTTFIGHSEKIVIKFDRVGCPATVKSTELHVTSTKSVSTSNESNKFLVVESKTIGEHLVKMLGSLGCKWTTHCFNGHHTTKSVEVGKGNPWVFFVNLIQVRLGCVQTSVSRIVEFLGESHSSTVAPTSSRFSIKVCTTVPGESHHVWANGSVVIIRFRQTISNCLSNQFIISVSRILWLLLSSNFDFVKK
ncbi:hypothetical protein OGAPHI_007247 [Ogataea philodendri]|uniref:Zn(2)-C6 fungal-type domain-containing protein n=1 Tax=Ogataea philodendri TaxID=1378263 RepID=A0A9P8NVK4_9ASCO|nr:uncharacterized protein OGAPHI_007247 [Ogataea philodendri]KAH3660042.1 hypothetical protein OGAPHI_007247 [Ogataea philodendri]